MKFTKLSLVAALAVSAAFAGGDIEPVAAPVVETSPWTFGGDFKLFYDTTSTDVDGSPSLFDQASATGQGEASVDVSYAFADTWKVNFGATGLFTLGLDDSVVSNVWLLAGADATDGAFYPIGTSIGDALWIDTFNITGTAFDGKATFILGRTELDTPLAFSEKWNIAPNTFDAAVAMVKPIDELTLVAGYIYDGNGNGGRITTFNSTARSGAGGFTGDRGYFPLATDTVNEISNGAWTVAAIGTFAGVTAQAWYYDVMDVAQAAWIQADADFSGFTIGGQYAWIGADDTLVALIGDTDDSSALAGKLGYKMDAFNVWAAYSSVDTGNGIYIGNTATMLGGGSAGGVGFGWQAQSKLYTEAWWNYGNVGNAGSDTFAAAANYNYGDVSILNGVELMAQYTNVQNDNGTISNPYDMNEFTALVGATAYGLNVQLAYIWSDYSYDLTPADDFSADTIQAYLTYAF